MKAAAQVFLASAILLAPGTGVGRASPVSPQSPSTLSAQATQSAPDEERPTGLPKAIQWTFNLDAGWGTFGFANSLYTNPKDDLANDLSDQWFEGYAKPALSGSYTRGKSVLYGKLSVVGERTYGSAPSVAGTDISSYGFEDAAVGWRSGKTVEGHGDNVVDVTVGRTRYRLGHGFLLYDGASEGGSRGGYWTNARRAFEFATIARVTPGPHHAEFFYLDKDELPESDSGSKVVGGNYEFSFNAQSTVGATYIKAFADAAVRPARDGMNVYDFRAFVTPMPRAAELSLELEYAREDNGEVLDSIGWYLQGAYELSKVGWTPKLSYRYAFFQGDDPATAASEAFDPLFLGFDDWGAWWQGEIAGEYFLSNSNLISHEVRAHLTPSDAIGTGVIYFHFNADQPASLAPGVTASDIASELDWYMDWKLNENFTVSLVGAFADPGKAAEQAFGRTKSFTYGMANVAYSF